MILIQACSGAQTPKQEIFNKEFNWTVTILENFVSVRADDWAKMQNRGAEAIETTTGEKIVNQTKSIFVFRNDDYNYFESNYQPFDPEVDGDYLESCKAVEEVLYNAFSSSIPGAKIARKRSTERIDGLEFQKLEFHIELPNKTVLTMLMYSRLFGKREFAVNICYVNELKAQKMLDSWRQSRFTR